MRITIDLPDDLHQLAKRIARDTSRSLSETVVDLVRRGLADRGATPIKRSERTGLLVVSVGRTITSEDVRAFDAGTP
jgi:metal-responsive CopG/Arc/MetJ family transcriptional regulator